MSDSEMKTIAGEVEKTLGVLCRLFDYLSDFLSDRLPEMGKTTDSAFVVAGALENYYTADLLGELMRFRHFRRYYFALDYDWRRLDALIAIFGDAHPSLMTDLETFLATLSDPNEEGLPHK
ncbi:MAG: hypothetical protein KOO61_00025 [Spirochaetales bacterium]|nr:hypothetical protein [Spirochaetales bacterium]